MKSIQRILGESQRQNETNGLPCGDHVYKETDPREAMWKLDATMSKEEALKFKYLGKIVADEQVDDFVLNGKSLLDLPSDNPACASVKAIMKTTGYIQQ
jgi:hypothetical protein